MPRNAFDFGFVMPSSAATAWLVLCRLRKMKLVVNRLGGGGYE